MTNDRSTISYISEREPLSGPKFRFLFSYGTLQDDSVQLAVFGRRIAGFTDALPLFAQSVLELIDRGATTTGRIVHYPVISYSGRTTDVVRGTALRVTAVELRKADLYEGGAYRRVPAVLRSGACAWVYVDARSSNGRRDTFRR